MTYKEAYETLMDYLKNEFALADHYAWHSEQYNLDRQYMVGRRNAISAILKRAEEYEKEGLE